MDTTNRCHPGPDMAHPRARQPGEQGPRAARRGTPPGPRSPFPWSLRCKLAGHHW